MKVLDFAPRMDSGPGWRIEVFTCAYWIVMGKYVLRIGRPFVRPYVHAWRPLFKFFRCYK